MAAFVSLATCHHCPITSTRRGLIYRDSLSALSRNLRSPGCLHLPPGPPGPHGPRGPRLQASRHHCRLTRPDYPQSIALTRSKPSGGVKHLILVHLRRLLTSSPAHQQRGLRILG